MSLTVVVDRASTHFIHSDYHDGGVHEKGTLETPATLNRTESPSTEDQRTSLTFRSSRFLCRQRFWECLGRLRWGSRSRHRCRRHRAAGRDSWFSAVDWTKVDERLLKQFRTAIRKAERQHSERPMQIFFEEHPAALVLSVIAPHTCWVFPRLALQKALGGGWEVDFLICDWTSLGPLGTLVELESPTKSASVNTGLSSACHKAQLQISDYRRTMREHTERNRNDGSCTVTCLESPGLS